MGCMAQGCVGVGVTPFMVRVLGDVLWSMQTSKLATCAPLSRLRSNSLESVHAQCCSPTMKAQGPPAQLSTSEARPLTFLRQGPQLQQMTQPGPQDLRQQGHHQAPEAAAASPSSPWRLRRHLLLRGEGGVVVKVQEGGKRGSGRARRTDMGPRLCLQCETKCMHAG